MSTPIPMCSKFTLLCFVHLCLSSPCVLPNYTAVRAWSRARGLTRSLLQAGMLEVDGSCCLPGRSAVWLAAGRVFYCSRMQGWELECGPAGLPLIREQKPEKGRETGETPASSQALQDLIQAF